MSRRIIALSGKAGSGKDTVGDYLTTRYGFEKVSFAQYLKSIAKNQFGWDGKKDDRGRELLQKLGHVVREYDNMFWIRPVISYIMGNPDKDIVVTDMRYYNELEALDGIKATLVRLERDECYKMGDMGRHESEVALDHCKQFHFTITNNGGFDELFKSVDTVINPTRQA